MIVNPDKREVNINLTIKKNGNSLKNTCRPDNNTGCKLTLDRSVENTILNNGNICSM